NRQDWQGNQEQAREPGMYSLKWRHQTLTRTLFSCLVLAGLWFGEAAALSAAPLNVSNGNASIMVDPTSVFGLSSFVVDGVENLYEQQFWYRLSADHFETPLNALN